MQIVRSLGGYTMGQSDNIRRAMSKKKQYVIDENREYFVHGSAEKGISGCVNNGIDEGAANRIYDSMVDFAKYAFNKSHAACYAVVAYQTAYLKHYYPVEFMAALLTSIMDNSVKVSEYILTCKNMGINILPPDINEGEIGFSVKDGNIRYALTAIKAVGRPVIEKIVAERNARGPFKDLKDFIVRTGEGTSDVNKRAIENFIKAGAFDTLGGNRRQFMQAYSRIMDSVHDEYKKNIVGQMSLFDVAPEADKSSFTQKLPPVEEFAKADLLAFEKEVLGMYLSGHPIEEYEALWRKQITAKTTDFLLDEETGVCSLEGGKSVTVGGLIAEKKIKYTKNDKIMAFVTLEDLLGSVEVIVFPRDYEKYGSLLEEDNKVFIKGRVSDDEDRDSKLICESVILFEDVPRKLWIQFATMEDYMSGQGAMNDLLASSDGNDSVIIYIRDKRLKKELPRSMNVKADSELLEALAEKFGEDNVKVT